MAQIVCGFIVCKTPTTGMLKIVNIFKLIRNCCKSRVFDFVRTQWKCLLNVIVKDFNVNELQYPRIMSIRTYITVAPNIQGLPIKTIPLKILYLRNCSSFFHQIYNVYRGGFQPHIQQILLQYSVGLRNYNYLNLKVHFSK